MLGIADRTCVMVRLVWSLGLVASSLRASMGSGTALMVGLAAAYLLFLA